jgi:signal transduction histidine kinase
MLRTLRLVVLMIGVASGLVAAWVADPDPTTVSPWRWRLILFLKNSLFWGLWAVLVPLVAEAAERIAGLNWPRWRSLPLHALLALLVATGHLSLVALADDLLRLVVLAQAPLEWRVAVLWKQPPRLAIEWEITLYAAVVAFVSTLRLQGELQRRALAEARLETRLTEARLAMLETQLRPHFLFNTLHAVGALVRRDPDTAERMLVHLAQLLRTTLERNSGRVVRLADDLATLHDYLEIERIQMGDRLTVSVDVAPDAAEGEVPLLLLQPLVENSIRHGLQPRASGGHVDVRARRTGARLRVEVADDGIGIGPTLVEGVGLGNTRARLAELYRDAHEFAISSRPTGGVVVTLEIPFRAAVA